jgi:hypothetical protein
VPPEEAAEDDEDDEDADVDMAPGDESGDGEESD